MGRLIDVVAPQHGHTYVYSPDEPSPHRRHEPHVPLRDPPSESSINFRWVGNSLTRKEPPASCRIRESLATFVVPRLSLASDLLPDQGTAMSPLYLPSHRRHPDPGPDVDRQDHQDFPSIQQSYPSTDWEAPYRLSLPSMAGFEDQPASLVESPAKHDTIILELKWLIVTTPRGGTRRNAWH